MFSFLKTQVKGLFYSYLLRGAIKKKPAKVGTLSEQGGGGGLGQMADVPTSIVGENGIAGRKKSLLGEKSHCWEKNIW